VIRKTAAGPQSCRSCGEGEALAEFPAPGVVMREIRRILCPVDLSEVSRHAVQHAVLLAHWYDAMITALHVWNPRVISSTDFAFVGSVHGRNALDLMLFGSTTNQVVRRATCPVLTLRR
jgi:nucleotide-binding universal stress UspA family protein